MTDSVINSEKKPWLKTIGAIVGIIVGVTVILTFFGLKPHSDDAPTVNADTVISNSFNTSTVQITGDVNTQTIVVSGGRGAIVSGGNVTIQSGEGLSASR